MKNKKKEKIEGWEEQIKNELIDLVDEYFPKIKPQGGNKGRGEAMVLIARILISFDKFISQAISEAREEEKQKHLANLRVMLALGDEIVEEAMPNYEDNDNEVYTIVDWQINARKLRKLYPKELSQKQLKK